MPRCFSSAPSFLFLPQTTHTHRSIAIFKIPRLKFTLTMVCFPLLCFTLDYCWFLVVRLWVTRISPCFALLPFWMRCNKNNIRFNEKLTCGQTKYWREQKKKPFRFIFFYHFACGREKYAVQFKWYAIITVTRVEAHHVCRCKSRKKNTRANFNHFVLMESTRSVFKQLVQSGYKHLVCFFFSSPSLSLVGCVAAYYFDSHP